LPCIVKKKIVVEGAVGVAVDQSMGSSILNSPPMLLQEEGKHLSVHSVSAS